jgi:ATP-binding cassette, subfamily F, member 3
MIQAHGISLSFGDQPVFDNVSFTINQHDRIGLVGRNGSGKTTLLKAIQNPADLDGGTISIQSKKKVAYMPQEVVLQSSLSIFDEAFSTFAELCKLQKEHAQLEAELEKNADVLERYTLLSEQIAGWAPEILAAKTKKLLMGLGFSAQQFEQPVSSLSVGWKMRVVLAKLLLQEADFYLFDEPTNHLDLIAKEWFLEFLKTADFGFLLICHERYFLDELCDKILELERGKATWYNGNYSKYIVQKEHDLELLHASFVQQQKDIKKKEEWIAKFKAKASTAKRAQSMMRALDDIERIELPRSPKNVSFSFPPVQQSGKLVITVDKVSQKFGDKTIFQNVSFEVTRNQKVAIIAPNGVGKTTLFNLIAGILPIQKGTITFGYNVSHAIFAQDQNKALNLQLSILDNLKHLCPKVAEQKIRAFLGAFLFSGDDALKKVSVLSGGEKNRVGMVSVLLQQANLLLLDEPTNHLDIPSKEILLKALQDFEGTLLFVSHDRDFINNLATDIIELTAQGAHHYEGNYDAYVYHKQANDRALAKGGENSGASHTADQKFGQKNNAEPNSQNNTKNPAQLERKMAKLEQQIDQINHSFADLEYDTKEFSAALEKLEQLQQELKEVEAEWEKSQS